MTAMGAVRGFGLLEKHGDGLRVSELARNILQDTRPASAERKKWIQEAALRPKIHEELWRKYKGDIPSDENLSYELRRHRGFTEKGAKEFIAQFRATLAYAKLTEDASISVVGSETDADESRPPSIALGDYIQWTSGGMDQFRVPRRVRGVSERGTHVFVEGTETGVPIEEATRVDAPTLSLQTKPPAARPGMNQDSITLDEGQVILQWPANISPENYEDLKAWLDVMTRRIARAAGVQPEKAR